LSAEHLVGAVGGGEPDFAFVELSAELREPVFGEVVHWQLKDAGDELERAAAWELAAGGEVDEVAVAEPIAGAVHESRLGGERAVADDVLAHQRRQRLGEGSVGFRWGASHVGRERSRGRLDAERGFRRRLRLSPRGQDARRLSATPHLWLASDKPAKGGWDG
jgi:hypothetical protein